MSTYTSKIIRRISLVRAGRIKVEPHPMARLPGTTDEEHRAFKNAMKARRLARKQPVPRVRPVAPKSFNVKELEKYGRHDSRQPGTGWTKRHTAMLRMVKAVAR